MAEKWLGGQAASIIPVMEDHLLSEAKVPQLWTTSNCWKSLCKTCSYEFIILPVLETNTVTWEDELGRDEGASADLLPATCVQRHEDGSHPGEVAEGTVAAEVDQKEVVLGVNLVLRPATSWRNNNNISTLTNIRGGGWTLSPSTYNVWVFGQAFGISSECLSVYLTTTPKRLNQLSWFFARIYPIPRPSDILLIRVFSFSTLTPLFTK